MALVALLAAGRGDPFALIAVATIANTLGSVVNWLCGRFLMRYRDARWFPVSPARIERWSTTFRRYGLASLLLAWAPIGGDALTVVAGILKVPIVPFVILVGLGKLGRYLVVAGAAQLVLG